MLKKNKGGGEHLDSRMILNSVPLSPEPDGWAQKPKNNPSLDTFDPQRGGKPHRRRALLPSSGARGRQTESPNRRARNIFFVHCVTTLERHC